MKVHTYTGYSSVAKMKEAVKPPTEVKELIPIVSTAASYVFAPPVTELQRELPGATPTPPGGPLPYDTAAEAKPVVRIAPS